MPTVDASQQRCPHILRLQFKKMDLVIIDLVGTDEEFARKCAALPETTKNLLEGNPPVVYDASNASWNPVDRKISGSKRSRDALPERGGATGDHNSETKDVDVDAGNRDGLRQPVPHSSNVADSDNVGGAPKRIKSENVESRSSSALPTTSAPSLANANSLHPAFGVAQAFAGRH